MGFVVSELSKAYKSLVKITTQKLTAEQLAHLNVVEQHIARALQHAARNPIERDAVRSFIAKQMKRETDTEPLG